jgi:hypothetical protein
MDDFSLTERVITAAEFATILRVTEDDVLGWMLAGHIPYVEGPDREPRVRIAEQRAVDGPISRGFTTYSLSRDPAFQDELAHRRRELGLAALDWGNVDVEALADALASRLSAVVPSPVRAVCSAGTVFLRDADGHGPGIDIAFHASFPEAGSGADRVCAAAAAALQSVQDELTMLTTDPWPLRDHGELPAPHAELMPGATSVRLFYGDPMDPVLELEPLRVREVLLGADD